MIPACPIVPNQRQRDDGTLLGNDSATTHHAQQVKAWAGTGGERPSGDVPKSLIARRQARDRTVEEIGAAKVACKALSNDLDAAKAALAEAERAASEATEPVMLEQAERDATFLVAARREVWRLEAKLRALGETWISRREGPRAVRISRKILDALGAQEPQYVPSMRPEIKEAAAWRAFHTALLTDPDRTWEEGSPMRVARLRSSRRAS
jgi:hypothetical protein